MNVTQNAYFTTGYLQENQYQPQSSLKINPDDDEPRNFSRSNPPSKSNHCRSKMGQLNSHAKQINGPRNGPGRIRSAKHISADLNQPEMIMKKHGDSRNLVDCSDYYGTRVRNGQGRNSETNSAKNGTFTRLFLRKEVFPHTELPYNANDEAFFHGDDTSLYEPSIPNHLRFSGFYIDQQRRYEQAEEIKPNMYTHKTFQDVFREEEEKRLNPMDVVFDDPSKRKLNTRQKMKQALKQAKNKLGKNDHTDYTYHREPVNFDEPESLAVKSEYSDSEMGDNYANSINDSFDNELVGDIHTERALEKSSESATATVLPSTTKLSSSSSSSISLKSQIRQKLRISKNSSKGNGQSPLTEDDLVDENSPIRDFHGADVSDHYETVAASSHINQVDNFHPLWKSMLSWLVYDNDLGAEFLEPGKITELEPEIKHGREDMSGDTHDARDHAVLYEKNGHRKHKHRIILLNWSKPASAYISGKEMQKKTKGVLRKDYTFLRLTSNTGNPEEEEEFHYNSESQALTPTSSNRDLMHSQGHSVCHISHENSPKAIVSNINKLIKNIRIMRIIFSPIDVVAENFPRIQTFVIFIELFIFMWLLYELSLLIDALCMAVKAVCAPMIAIGKFMNRIV
ncbi:hypothetical protein METSCH_C02240 [Metschnikowia aff. pulcherrima]|uniref:Uncharacterized protein n=1 Tax=Metschnikowia aff. pulcherrima TaxID=2163413 RepID=A0A4P6XQC7_9ASCO|nr:hypothetical protein METSCH_C02240 [Metschnikowia aff. pulcherrima]